jgi:hypothetical protein
MTYTSGWRGWLLVAVGAPATMMAVSAFVSEAAQQPRDSLTVAERECPGPYMSIVDTVGKRGSNEIVNTYTKVKLAKEKSQVAEFHDCQDFIVGRSYRGQYAVFASYALDSLDEVMKQGTSNSPTIAAGAEIFTRNGTYAPLHILPGFSCIYFSSSTGFKTAYVTNSRHDEKQCELTSAAELVGAPTLAVRQVPYGALVDVDYPDVARWQRHREGQYFIGMKCGAAWCEVGTPDANQAPPTSTAAANDPTRVEIVPGWNDEQTLALPAGAGVTPGNLIGRVIPTTSLNAMNAPIDFANWTNAGHVLIEGDAAGLQQYWKKLGVRGGGTNDLDLRFYVRRLGQYPGIASLPPRMATAIRTSGKDTVWLARVITPFKKDTTYLKVIRTGHEHDNFHIPGTIRWRWQSRDETIWVRCLEGCCQVQQSDGDSR